MTKKRWRAAPVIGMLVAISDPASGNGGIPIAISPIVWVILPPFIIAIPGGLLSILISPRESPSVTSVIALETFLLNFLSIPLISFLLIALEKASIIPGLSHIFVAYPAAYVLSRIYYNDAQNRVGISLRECRLASMLSSTVFLISMLAALAGNILYA